MAKAKKPQKIPAAAMTAATDTPAGDAGRSNGANAEVGAAAPAAAPTKATAAAAATTPKQSEPVTPPKGGKAAAGTHVVNWLLLRNKKKHQAGDTLTLTEAEATSLGAVVTKL